MHKEAMISGGKVEIVKTKEGREEEGMAFTRLNNKGHTVLLWLQESTISTSDFCSSSKRIQLRNTISLY